MVTWCEVCVFVSLKRVEFVTTDTCRVVDCTTCLTLFLSPTITIIGEICLFMGDRLMSFLQVLAHSIHFVHIKIRVIKTLSNTFMQLAKHTH